MLVFELFVQRMFNSSMPGSAKQVRVQTCCSGTNGPEIEATISITFSIK
jgi:hypothetical protein